MRRIRELVSAEVVWKRLGALKYIESNVKCEN